MLLSAGVVSLMEYNRRTEQLLREEIGRFDMIVNCVLWDTTRTDHIIYRLI